MTLPYKNSRGWSPLPHDGLMIEGHVRGVGLPVVIHRRQIQASVVSGERTRFFSATNVLAQLPEIVNLIANFSSNCRRPGYCS